MKKLTRNQMIDFVEKNKERLESIILELEAKKTDYVDISINDDLKALVSDHLPGKPRKKYINIGPRRKDLQWNQKTVTGYYRVYNERNPFKSVAYIKRRIIL